MKKFLKKSIANVKRYFLKQSSFSIISDNCWGGFVYQNYNIGYTTPFVGLFVFSPDYLMLLKNLRQYMDLPLVFISANQSKYKEELVLNNTFDTYPIGKIGDVELHFLHYSDQLEAMDKWNRRKERIDYDNIIVKYCDRDLSTDLLVEEFLSLNFEKKICLTAREFDHPSNIKLSNENGICIENEWSNFKKTVIITSFMNKL